LKIFFYDKAEGEMAEYFKERIVAELVRLGHQVETFSQSIKEDKLVRDRHFQMYDHIFNILKNRDYDLFFHNNFLAVPEYFLAGLKANPEIKTKIVFFFQFREINRSMARALVLNEILEQKQVYRAIGISMVKDPLVPKNYIASGIGNSNKIKIINETYTEPRKSFINKIQRPHKPFTIGYFGRQTEAKGIDIFLEATKHIDKSIKILVNMPHKEWFWENTEERKKFKRIKIDSHFYPIGQLHKFVDKLDLIICPHKRSYEYGESGMPGVAFSAGIPIIAPDFYFFNKIVKKYKTGLTFIPESPRSLANAINIAKYLYEELIFKANFDAALDNYIEIEEYARIAVT
jgi:glycosyltransferase involved in cell wall biosynthesis